MPNKMRLIGLTVIALFALLLAACGGADGALDDADSGDSAPDTTSPADKGDSSDDGDDSDSSGNGDSSSDNDDGGDVFGDFGGNDDLFVSNGAEVFAASAEQFDEEITSMEGDMALNLSGGGVNISMNADFAFRVPDAMYMSLEMDGDDGSGIDIGEFGNVELIVRDGAFYMKTPLFGPQWIEMSFEDLGADAVEIENMLNDGSSFDYQEFVDEIEGIEFVGEQTVDGRQMLHYQVSVDASTALESFEGTLDSSSTGGSSFDSFSDLSGPVSMDVWIGKSDFLPYIITMDADVTSPSTGDVTMDMTMNITGYNTDVYIPEAPADAISFEDLFGDLFGDLFEEGGFSGIGQ